MTNRFFWSCELKLTMVLAIGTVAMADDEVTITRFGRRLDSALAKAVAVSGADLAHTTQLLPDTVAGEMPEKQVASLLRKLDEVMKSRSARRDDLVKLNIYLADDGLREAVVAALRRWVPAGSEPAITFVTSTVRDRDALVALDAVFSADAGDQPFPPARHHLEALGGPTGRSHVSILPRGDVVYVSGQAEEGDLATATRETLAGLSRTLEHLGLNHDHIVSLKCFLQPMNNVDVVDGQIAEFFGEVMIPPVSHVEWISSEKQPIEIELIAWAPPEESAGTVSHINLPWLKTSPIYSRAARIHGDRRIYISGLCADQPGDGQQQVRSIFAQLESLLRETGSDLRHLAKATYYVSQEDPSRQLNALRPKYYDPKHPPAASKAQVHGVGERDRGIAIDMIATPTP